MWDTSCITDADVYPAEAYRKLRSAKQTSRIFWSFHTNNCTRIRLAPDRDVHRALVHIYTQRSCCFQLFFLQRCLSWSYLEVGGWRALWENNDPGCLCQNKLPFLSDASDRSAPHDGAFCPPLQQTDEVPAPPIPGGVFSCPNLTIMSVYKLVKGGTSQIIYGLSKYVSRKCLNMHPWHWKSSRCLWSVTFVFIKFSPFHLKLPKCEAERKPLTYLQKNPYHIQKECLFLTIANS